MKRWLIPVLLVLATACATTPTPTPSTNVIPTNSIATLVPIPTLLPTSTVPFATLPVETVAATAEATQPAVRATTAPAIAFAAPAPIEPNAPTLFKDGNDIKFKYASVGPLKPNQCYLLHIEMAIPNRAEGNRGDDFLDTAHCGDPGPVGKPLEFVLYRGKFTNSPNYGTMLAQILAIEREVRKLNMTWTVRVVQNNGRAADGVHYNTAVLSPPSTLSEFEFQP